MHLQSSKCMLFVQLLYSGNNNKYQIYAICIILHISIKEWLMYKMQMLYNGTKILWDILERLLSNSCFAHNGPSHLVLFVVKSSFLRILLDIKDLSLLDIKKGLSLMFRVKQIFLTYGLDSWHQNKTRWFGPTAFLMWQSWKDFLIEIRTVLIDNYLLIERKIFFNKTWTRMGDFFNRCKSITPSFL